jgi:broad specificity phosphatase PhoE
MLLTFVRHGITEMAEKGMSQTGDTPLSETAVKVLTEMSSNFDARKYDYVYTSTYRRAQQTAEILFGKHMYKILDYVHEGRLSPHMHGKTWEETHAYWTSLPEHLRYDPDYRHNDGQVFGESFNEFMGRVQKFIDFLINEHKNEDQIALVGHGLFFQAIVAILMKSPGFDFKTQSDFFRYFTLQNGCIVTVEIFPENRSGVIREMKNWKIM